ncbi:TPA: hypothetical protein ACPJ1P_003470 [Vibrio diabolicus]
MLSYIKKNTIVTLYIIIFAFAFLVTFAIESVNTGVFYLIIMAIVVFGFAFYFARKKLLDKTKVDITYYGLIAALSIYAPYLSPEAANERLITQWPENLNEEKNQIKTELAQLNAMLVPGYIGLPIFEKQRAINRLMNENINAMMSVGMDKNHRRMDPLPGPALYLKLINDPSNIFNQLNKLLDQVDVEKPFDFECFMTTSRYEFLHPIGRYACGALKQGINSQYKLIEQRIESLMFRVETITSCLESYEKSQKETVQDKDCFRDTHENTQIVEIENTSLRAELIIYPLCVLFLLGLKLGVAGAQLKWMEQKRNTEKLLIEYRYTHMQ